MDTSLQLADELDDSQSRCGLVVQSRPEAVMVWHHAQRRVRLPRQPLHESFSSQLSRWTHDQLRRAGHLPCGIERFILRGHECGQGPGTLGPAAASSMCLQGGCER